MNIADIITQLRTYATVFGERVHGAAEYSAIEGQEVTSLAVPSAYVIPISDETTETTSKASNAPHIEVTSNFAVLVVVDNTTDRTGLAGVKSYDAIRTALWAALFNWPVESSVITPLRYRGSRLIERNRARLSWAFNFSYGFTITPADGFQPTFNNFDTIHVDVDMISPNNGTTGPDGQIDAVLHFENLAD